jgi:hypothetical protein
VISIYCDEDVDILIKPLLEAKGFMIITTQDEQMLGSSDKSQIEHAARNVSVFLTHNRVHFEQLYTELASKDSDHWGIMIASRRNVYELARRVSKVLSRYTKEATKNQLFYV